jgi:hypothetical protein
LPVPPSMVRARSLGSAAKAAETSDTGDCVGTGNSTRSRGVGNPIKLSTSKATDKIHAKGPLKLPDPPLHRFALAASHDVRATIAEMATMSRNLSG